MPWKEVSVMEERMRFVSLAQSGRFEMKKLCEEFGISRKSGYKWVERYQEQGSEGLKDRSRAPRHIAGRTDREVEEMIVNERRRHPTWGPKKIAAILERNHRVERVPAKSTIGEILKRNGLIEARRRRPGAFSVARRDLQQAERSNHVWACDYKGWFTLGNGERCDPLTLSDEFSRYVIRLEAVAQATQRWTRAGFERAFRAYGLPERIRVDNGSPFASMGPGGLSKLSAWVSLGIEVEFTRPGHPQDNGRHERMHRTMKKECCEPASANRDAQQRRFERWREQFNHERPHEAIDFAVPGDLYQPSHRGYPLDVTVDLYEPSEEILPVSSSGAIYWEGKNWMVGEAFAGLSVVLEANPEPGAQPDTKLVRFANIRLGIIGDRSCGRLRPTASPDRRNGIPCKKPQTQS